MDVSETPRTTTRWATVNGACGQLRISKSHQHPSPLPGWRARISSFVSSFSTSAHSNTLGVASPKLRRAATLRASSMVSANADKGSASLARTLRRRMSLTVHRHLHFLCDVALNGASPARARLRGAQVVCGIPTCYGGMTAPRSKSRAGRMNLKASTATSSRLPRNRSRPKRSRSYFR